MCVCVCVTTRHLAAGFGMQETIPDLVMEQQLRWLGHVGCMDEERKKGYQR